MRLIKVILTLGCLMLGVAGAQAQAKLKFAVAEFSADPFDLSARNAQYKRYDGSGDLYAIIKVKSTNPDDNLAEYNFNFGNMKHIVEEHDGTLWIYVQRNAKQVSISRKGYVPVDRYDLNTTIESGKNYVMTINAEARIVVKQMVQFNVMPADVTAVVMTKDASDDATEELFGSTDATGGVAKLLPYGIYTYRVMAERYKPADGRFTLNDRSQTLVENVTLRPNFADVTLEAERNAEIFVNGEKMGTGGWKGILDAGTYQVESRLPGCKPSQEFITVVEEQPLLHRLAPPQAIRGVLALTSNPLGADIAINNNKYGQTPRSIDLPIGKYNLSLSKNGYKPQTAPFEIKEDETTELNIVLEALLQKKKKEKEVKVEPQPKPQEKATADNKAKDKTKEAKKTAAPKQNKPHKNKFYVEAGGSFGSLLSATVGFGANFGKFNAEVGYSYGLASDKLFVNDPHEDWIAGHKREYKPFLIIDGKIGYSITKNKINFTPQIGVRFTKVKEQDKDGFYEEINGAYCSCLTLGIRVHYALSSHFGLSLTPTYAVGIIKSDGFKILSNASSKIKGFAEGFNAKLSLVYSF